MPGGSVNGRPFRDVPDSYRKTGIPCGNPKRFKSRDVLKMGVQNQSAFCKPLTGPVEDIETEKDRQLQNLLQKQLNTNMTLQEQFNQHKKFSDGVYHQSSTDSLSGSISLDQYKDLSQLDSYIIQLKHCGLSEEEIELKLEDCGYPTTKKLRLNLEPGTRESKLKTIEEKIAKKKTELQKVDKFAGAKKMGRHEMDLERAISQNTDRGNLLSCLLTTSRQRSEQVNSDDPMDHLPEILESLTKRGTSKRKRRKKRQSLEQGKAVCPENIVEEASEAKARNSEHGSLVNVAEEKTTPTYTQQNTGGNRCDNTGGEGESVACGSDTDSVLHGHNNQGSNLQSFCGKIDPIPEEDIIRDRLSLTEIQRLERFKDYTPGEPSKVLYLKNLPTKVCEEDLIRLFIKFQKEDGPQIVFKLMKGRMRGQGFVTFDSPDSATEALQLINGYNLRGKPIIIQYGRKTPTDSG